MTEPPKKKKKKKTPGTTPYREPARAAEPVASEADAEAAVYRWLVPALPIATVLTAMTIGLASSAGPAILVLVGGVLLGAILLFWNSVRSLTGDAPVAGDLAAASLTSALSEAQERKKRALRALKDIENEHALGKLDDADYEALAAQYRAEAKDAMRDLDAEIEPVRARAEEIARAHLERRGLQEEESLPPEDAPTEDPEVRTCAECETVNDADATFCKKCGEKLDDAA